MSWLETDIPFASINQYSLGIKESTHKPRKLEIRRKIADSCKKVCIVESEYGQAVKLSLPLSISLFQTNRVPYPGPNSLKAQA
jgi:hypothetical protein